MPTNVTYHLNIFEYLTPYQKIEDAMISDGEEDDPDSEDEVVKAATNPFGRPSKGIYRSVKMNLCSGFHQLSVG